MAADFTPSRGNYKDLTPFRYWCQKVLPLVYDDSLSYYEVLAKMVESLNMAMEDVNTLNDDVGNLYTAYDQLQEWVNDYYVSADFRQAIDDGIDRLVDDGTIPALVDAKVADVINGVVAGQIGAVVADQIGGAVGEQIGAVVADQIGSTVAGQIGAVVANQIYAVVASQIGNTVSSQLPGVVSTQLPSEVSRQITTVVNNWLSANINTSSVLDYSFSQESAGAIAKETGILLNGIKSYKQNISATGKDYGRYTSENNVTHVYTDYDLNGRQSVIIKYTSGSYAIPNYVPLTRNLYSTSTTQGNVPILSDTLSDFTLIGPPNISLGDKLIIRGYKESGVVTPIEFTSAKILAVYTVLEDSALHTAEIVDITDELNSGFVTIPTTINFQHQNTIKTIGLCLALSSNFAYFSSDDWMSFNVTAYSISDINSDTQSDWLALEDDDRPMSGDGVYNLIHNRNSILYTDALASYATSGDIAQLRADILGVIGDLTTLTTTNKSSVVGAINEVKNDVNTTNTNIGNLSLLPTSDKTSLVGSIREIYDNVDAKVGDMAALETTHNSNLVSAINEVNSKASTNSGDIGNLNSLTTVNKNSVVGAINEVNSVTQSNNTSIGNISNLTTTDKSSLTNAVNEVNANSTANTSSIGVLSNLVTSEKSTLVGAINEVHDSVYGLYPQASVGSTSIASFPDGAEDIPVKSLTVEVEPVQDLHGQTSPYPAGCGKNLCPMTVADIKSLNTGGTWVGNVYTIYSVTFTVLTDSANNVTGIQVNGTPTADITFIVAHYTGENLGFILNGCPSDGSDSTYKLTANNGGSDYGSGVNITNDWNGYVTIYIYAQVSNIVFKPMVRLSTVSDGAFAPYSNICPITGWSQAKVTRTGVNVWDEEWELGYLGSDGVKRSANDCIVTKNYIPIVGGMAYYYKAPNAITIHYYDASKAHISGANATNAVKEAPSNARYMMFYAPSAYGTTYNHDISINYPSTDTDYHSGANNETYTIDLSTTRYGGTLDVGSGVLTVTHGIVDLGTRIWSKSGTRFYIGYTVSNPDRPYAPDGSIVYVTDAICSQYAATSRANIESVSSGFSIHESGSSYVTIHDEQYNNLDTASFKTAMNGVQLVYELAEPVTVQLTAEEVTTLLGTNNIFADTGNVAVVYRADLALYINKVVNAG